MAEDAPEDALNDGTPAGDDALPETESHDIPLPEHLLQAIAQDWGPAPPMPHPAGPEVATWAAARRSALSAKFPGQVVVVPAGGLTVRSNDTDYPFRAAS